MHRRTASPWRRRAIVLATMVAALVIFFRDALLSGMTHLYGDAYDGLIETAILGHWHDVATRGAAWNLTGWFAPYPDTLGYNDTYIVPGVFFTFARLLGADPFLATLLSHVAMKSIGFLGMYALLRRGLAIGTAMALLGAALFATANASLLHMQHAQLLAVGLVPWLMLLAIETTRAAIDDRRADMWHAGIGLALLFGVTALNSFYQAWFFGMFALVFVPIGLVVAGRARRAALWRAARRHWPVLAGIAAMAALALVPFLLVYLPKLKEGGGHDFVHGVREYLPILQTYVNVGEGNLVWGKLLGIARFHHGEHRFGFPLGLLALAIVAGIWAFRHRRTAPVMAATAVSLLILALLMTRWSSTFTLWEGVYAVVPGASGVRVISRFLLVLLIPMIALAMLLLDRWRARWPAAVALVAAFLLVEQVQLRAPLLVNRALHNRMLAAGPPPAGCEAFFVVSARPPHEDVAAEADAIVHSWGGNDGPRLLPIYRHNVDAMLLASHYGRPTINGFSTFNPPDWDFSGPTAPDYLTRVRAYARSHGITRLCGLDRSRAEPWFTLHP